MVSLLWNSPYKRRVLFWSSLLLVALLPWMITNCRRLQRLRLTRELEMLWSSESKGGPKHLYEAVSLRLCPAARGPRIHAAHLNATLHTRTRQTYQNRTKIEWLCDEHGETKFNAHLWFCSKLTDQCPRNSYRINIFRFERKNKIDCKNFTDWYHVYMAALSYVYMLACMWKIRHL